MSSGHILPGTVRTDPLRYLADELDAFKEQGLYRQLRVLLGRAEGQDDRRPPRGRQPLVEQLPRVDDASAAAGMRDRSDAPLRRRHRLGAADRRHARSAHGARAAARRLQADRSRRRVSERLRRQRRNGRGDPRQRRHRDLRRVESRQHHRWLPSQPGDDQGLPAQGRRRRARDPSRACRQRRASCSSPTASSAWTATSARCRTCARSPRNSAPS